MGNFQLIVIHCLLFEVDSYSLAFPLLLLHWCFNHKLFPLFFQFCHSSRNRLIHVKKLQFFYTLLPILAFSYNQNSLFSERLVKDHQNWHLLHYWWWYYSFQLFLNDHFQKFQVFQLLNPLELGQFCFLHILKNLEY